MKHRFFSQNAPLLHTSNLHYTIQTPLRVAPGFSTVSPFSSPLQNVATTKSASSLQMSVSEVSNFQVDHAWHCGLCKTHSFASRTVGRCYFRRRIIWKESVQGLYQGCFPRYHLVPCLDRSFHRNCSQVPFFLRLVHHRLLHRGTCSTHAFHGNYSQTF